MGDPTDRGEQGAAPFRVTVYKTNTAPLRFDDVTEIKMTALGVMVTHRWTNDEGDEREHTVSVRAHVIEQVIVVNEAVARG